MLQYLVVLVKTIDLILLHLLAHPEMVANG